MNDPTGKVTHHEYFIRSHFHAYFLGVPATVGSCHCRNRVTKRTGAESLTHSCDARDFQVSTEPGDQVDLAQSCWTI